MASYAYSSVREYSLGGGGHPWQGSGNFQSVDLISHPGWIRPEWISRDENLALTVMERGGSVWVSWPSGFDENSKPENMVDGDGDTAYYLRLSTHLREWAGGFPSSGQIFLDLGGAFKLTRVRFRPPEVQKAIYPELAEGSIILELGINDGDPRNVDARGLPLLSPIRAEEVGASSRVDWQFPFKLARYIVVKVDARRAEGFGISELEVYGEGFVPHSSYISEPIDLGDIAVWGDIRWDGIKPSDAKVFIRTRSGMDQDPNIYWRKTQEGLTNLAESGMELTRKQYEGLPEYEQGGVTHDREHWSFWSAPYPFEAGRSGTPIVSPGPRRYLQLGIEFVSTVEEAGEIGSISFRFSQPPSARQVVGEIWPVEVDPGKPTWFTYALRPRISRDDTGFDSLEIRTPAEATVSTVRRDGVDAPFRVEKTQNPRGFIVHFPKIHVDRMPLEVEFDCEVFRYGTEFQGRVFDSTRDQFPQPVASGNALNELLGDDLFVRIALDKPLIYSLGASPNPFTPNGDGANDVVEISYDLLHLTSPVFISLDIYDLSGVFVTRVFSGSGSSGAYSCIWDGRDDEGRLVLPGIYIYQISVEADIGREVRSGVVAVSY